MRILIILAMLALPAMLALVIAIPFVLAAGILAWCAVRVGSRPTPGPVERYRIHEADDMAPLASQEPRDGAETARGTIDSYDIKLGLTDDDD